MTAGVNAAVIAVCGAALVCALISHFITDGGTKKLLTLVMGAFMVCAVLMPVKNAAEGLWNMESALPAEEQLTATADEAYQNQLLTQTRLNLETALSDLLWQEGIEIHRAEIILALKDETRIIISQARIYISKEQTRFRDKIIEVTERNLSVTPSVITE